MARRMIDPQTIIKSQIVDDKSQVDLIDILEKYGNSNTDNNVNKTITLQIYNKYASDESSNYINNDSVYIGNVAFNGSLTITLYENGYVYIQGALEEVAFLEIISGSYENGIILHNPDPFDIYLIKV